MCHFLAFAAGSLLHRFSHHNHTISYRLFEVPIREAFQKEQPTPQQLIDSGEYNGPIPHGVYVSLVAALHELRTARVVAGLTLADVAGSGSGFMMGTRELL